MVVIGKDGREGRMRSLYFWRYCGVIVLDLFYMRYIKFYFVEIIVIFSLLLGVLCNFWMKEVFFFYKFL